MKLKLVEDKLPKFPLNVKDVQYGKYVQFADLRVGYILGMTLGDGGAGAGRLVVYLGEYNNWDIASRINKKCRILEHPFTITIESEQ